VTKTPVRMRNILVYKAKAVVERLRRIALKRESGVKIAPDSFGFEVLVWCVL